MGSLLPFESPRPTRRGGIGPFPAEAGGTLSFRVLSIGPFCSRSSMSWSEWAAAGKGWFGMKAGVSWTVGMDRGDDQEGWSAWGEVGLSWI